MRRVAAVLILALCSSTVSCGSDSSTNPTTASLAGTWKLTTVNGSPLPYVEQSGTTTIELLNDQITAAASGAFTESYNVRYTTNGQATTQPSTDAGTWSLNGTIVTIHFTSTNTTDTATLSGNTITIASSGNSGVYVKQ